MQTVATDRALIEAVAAEMSAGIDCAVNFWMSQIEAALLDSQLTTLGRFHAVQDIVKCYRNQDAVGPAVIDTLRNSLRVVGAAIMNSEMVYSFLIGMGWFFLLGWVVACASVFRQDGAVQVAGAAHKLRISKWAIKQKP